MNEKGSLLDELRTWFNNEAPALAAIGCRLDFNESLFDRDKHSTTITVTSARRIAQLVVWDTVEAELSMGDLTSGRRGRRA
jgi:hypothetical protein